MILVDNKYQTGFTVSLSEGKVRLIASRKSRKTGRIFWDWCRVRVPGKKNADPQYRRFDIPLHIVVGETREEAIRHLKQAIKAIQEDDVPF